MSGAGDTRWLSYAELADIRGTDTESAIRLVRRRGWPKQKANDGTVRVAVPADMIPDTKPRPRDTTPDNTGDITGDTTGDITPDNQEVAELHERAARAEGEAAALRDALTRAVDQVDATTRLAEARLTDLESSRAELTAAHLQAAQAAGEAATKLARAETEAEGLREALIEARRPAWRRWLGMP